MSSPTAPGAYTTHQLNTLFLRVPIGDWNLVKMGMKEEFRTKPRAISVLHKTQCPTPVVAYTVNRKGVTACKLMVLEEQHSERLIDIADDEPALMREGFRNYPEFKAYWRKRNGGIYKPLDKVLVHRLREWGHGEDMEGLGIELLTRLYGEYIPPCDFTEHVGM
jgi:hypothetical protein